MDSKVISFINKKGIIHSNETLLTTKSVEFGNMHICVDELIFEFKLKNKHYYEKFIENIEKLNSNFSGDSIEKEFKRYLPKIKDSFEDRYGDFIIIIEKESDLLNLADVLLFGEQIEEIPEKQKIWIINRLFNLICFLNYMNISHNGITLNNCYVSFSMHSLYLFGGWQYSTKLNELMQSCPKEVYTNLPAIIKCVGEAKPSVDISCLKSIGKLLFKTHKTRAFLKFFEDLNYSENIQELYHKWEDLTLSIYERKFDKWDLTHFDIY